MRTPSRSYIPQRVWKSIVQFPAAVGHELPQTQYFRTGCALAHPHRGPAKVAQRLGLLSGDLLMLNVMESILCYSGNYSNFHIELE